MNVYLVSSPGGHLTETLSAVGLFQGWNVSVITLDFPNVRNLVALDGVQRIHRIRLLFNYSLRLGMPLTLLKSFFSVFWIFLRRRPRLIFSTGSENALPALLVGKFLFRSKIIYMECFTRIETLSLTGRIVYRFSDLFLVQWPELTSKYPKAQFRGRLI